MFEANTSVGLLPDVPWLSAEELDAEERLIFELMDAGFDPAPSDEAAVLPPDLESWPADARLAAILSVVDVDRLTGSDRVRFLQSQERLNAAGSAVTLNVIRSVCDAYDQLQEDIEDPEAGASLEIRSALRWTRRAAETEMTLAHDLHVRLPRLFEALAAGKLDRARTRVLVNHTSHLSTAHARTVVDSLVGDAGRWTTGQLIERVRRACLDIDPDAARERYEESRSERRVTSWSDPDGTVNITGIGLDPGKATEARDLINRLARDRKTDDPSKTMDQLRADVFTELLTGTGDLPRAGRVSLTVDLATLAQLKDHAGDLAGYGPVIADISRQLTLQLGEGVWDWSVLHPDTGMPIADGTTRRRPTASQLRKVRAKNRTCVAPGCRMPVIDCDVDHTATWAETGVTDSNDLAALCRHDHCIRHQTGWTYEALPNGDYLWTSPLGCTYTTSGRDP